MRVKVEPKTDHDPIDNIQNDVEKEEDVANNRQTMKSIWNWIDRLALPTSNLVPICSLPAYKTFAIPPVAIVIVKNDHVKCFSLSFQGRYSFFDPSSTGETVVDSEGSPLAAGSCFIGVSDRLGA